MVVYYRVEPANQLVHDFPLLLIELGARVFGIAIERLGLLIDVAHQLLARLLAQRVASAIELVLELANFALPLIELRFFGAESGLNLGSSLLAVLSAHDGALDVNHADLA